VKNSEEALESRFPNHWLSMYLTKIAVRHQGVHFKLDWSIHGVVNVLCNSNTHANIETRIIIKAREFFSP
jgi:hypothetical protein